MKTVQISLNSIDKVKSFVNDITKFDYDFDLVSGTYFIIEKKNAVNTKKKQFVKICFYELFVFLVSSANLN